MITNPIGPFENVESAVIWARTPGNMQAPAAVYTDSYGRVYVQDAERARLFHGHEISHMINPETELTAERNTHAAQNAFTPCDGNCGRTVRINDTYQVEYVDTWAETGIADICLDCLISHYINFDGGI